MGTLRPLRLSGLGRGRERGTACRRRPRANRKAWGAERAAARGRSKFSGGFAMFLVGAKGQRSGGGVETEGVAGGGGSREGRLRFFLPWGGKGREGTWRGRCVEMSARRAGGGGGGGGGPAGGWTWRPASSLTAAFQDGAADEVILSGSPRAKAAGYPLPAPSDLPQSDPLPPRGNVLWLNSVSDFQSRLSSLRVVSLAQPRKTREV